MQYPAIILKKIFTVTDIHSVLHIGCGSGSWLHAARDLGAADIFGIDGPDLDPDSLVVPKTRVAVGALTKDIVLNRRFDLSLSVERAQSLPPAAEATLVRSLTRHADIVLFSAAPPGQDEKPAVNPQWPAHWAKLFAEQGYLCFDILRPDLWTEEAIDPALRQNLLLFIRQERWSSDPALRGLHPTPAPLAMVHPAVFERRLAKAAVAGEVADEVLEDPQARLERLGAALAGDAANLGLRLDFASALSDLGMHDDAATVLAETVVLAPEDVDITIRFFAELAAAGRDEAAQEVLEALHADHPEDIHFTAALGGWLGERGETGRALALLREAALADPDSEQLQNDIASLHQRRGEVAEALPYLRAVIRLEPESLEAHMALAEGLLSDCTSAEGFAELEWRRRIPGYPEPRSPAPLWEGQPLRGKRVLVVAELGFSESLQFARFLPALAAQEPAALFVECPGPLHRLIAAMPGVTGCLLPDAPLPVCDLQAPLLSLPKLLGRQGERFATAEGYLRVPEGDYFAVPADRRLKLGLAWEGDAVLPLFTPDRGPLDRSLEPAELSPLSRLAHCRCIGLQTGGGGEQLRGLGLNITDMSAILPDFATLAAAVARMDVIIAANGPLAHLAAAMGKPVWVLLDDNDMDYRWRRDGGTPWYPSARLFRAAEGAGWSDVVQAVAAALQAMAPATVVDAAP